MHFAVGFDWHHTNVYESATSGNSSDFPWDHAKYRHSNSCFVSFVIFITAVSNTDLWYQCITTVITVDLCKGQNNLCVFFPGVLPTACLFSIRLWPNKTKTISIWCVICKTRGTWCWRWPASYLPLVWLFQHCSSSGSVTLSSSHMTSGRDDQNFFDCFSFSFMSITWNTTVNISSSHPENEDWRKTQLS